MVGQQLVVCPLTLYHQVGVLVAFCPADILLTIGQQVVKGPLLQSCQNVEGLQTG